jgi:hypothetical protein
MSSETREKSFAETVSLVEDTIIDLILGDHDRQKVHGKARMIVEHIQIVLKEQDGKFAPQEKK